MPSPTAFVESCVQTAAGKAAVADRNARGRPRAKKLMRVLADKKNVLVTTHQHPDPDALASSYALCALLRAKLGKDALYEAILEPSAGISFGYEGWQLFLKNGDEASGLLVSETPDELAIKAVGGIVSRYKKSDVTARTQQRLSLMPADLQKTMSAQDLVDLVEYLTTLKLPAKAAVSREASQEK